MGVPEDVQKADARAEETSDRFRTYVGPLLILTSIFFINFISRIIPAPLMPKIEADLGISHAQAGSFFLLISIGYFVALIGSGFFSAAMRTRLKIYLLKFHILKPDKTREMQGLRFIFRINIRRVRFGDNGAKLYRMIQRC